MPERDFPAVFEELKPLLAAHEDRLLVKKDSADAYSLDTPYSEAWEKELLFGSVQIKKRYVSFHLFPVYMYPDLLDGISDELRARMQGKSCFNFTRVDPELREELRELATRSMERLEAEEVI
jgi:hypothetical protein